MAHKLNSLMLQFLMVTTKGIKDEAFKTFYEEPKAGADSCIT